MCFGGKTAFSSGRYRNTNVKQNLTPSTKDNLLRKKYYQKNSTNKTLKIEDYISTIIIKDFDDKPLIYSKFPNEGDKSNGTENRHISVNTVFRRYQAGNCFTVDVPLLKIEKSIRLRLVLEKRSLPKVELRLIAKWQVV